MASPPPPPPPFPSPFLLHFLLCATSSLLLVGGLNSEGTALLSFKSAVRDDPSGSFANWNSSHPDPCSWNGVTCRGGSVAALSLPKKKLVGFLPSGLGSLQSLRHVNLRNNRLFGGLPVGLFAATRLQSLVLYGNFFSGSVPQEIGDLSYLQSLDLSGNLFAGSLPSALTQCERLKTLILSHNNFTGPLPLGFGGSLAGLQKLDLSYNRFNGSIPSDLGNLSNLQGTLDLSHNRLSGSIPPGLGNLPEKVYIDLTYNDLSGPIPQNGALENRGPTAFVGNPNLCGPPLKNPCPSDSPSTTNPFLPNSYSPMALERNATNGGSSNNNNNNNRGLSKVAVIAIVASDVVAICLIALLFFYLYSKATASLGTEVETWKPKKECICFRKEDSETLSDDIEQYELVPLDKHMTFDLNELLKASAFVLGKSGIGIVYKAVLDSGLTMAVRRLGEGGSQRFKEFQTEVEAIGKVRHPNIVALRAYYWSIDEKLLIYDYIPNGNLSTAIHGRSETMNFAPLSWEMRLKIMKGIANGLAFLHEFSPKKYVHGDLKPNNVLLDSNMEPHISDFGVGRLANIAGGSSPFLQSDRIAGEKTQSQQQDVAFSPIISKGSCYQAPEALKTLKPSQKWDVYSFGVIVLELISGRSPVFLLETLAMDLVCWIRFCIEERKPLSDVLDPCLSQNLDRQDEIVAALKIGLACVQASSEKRPSMRSVYDTLERLINGS